MVSDTISAKRRHAALIGDACLLTAATFAVATAVVGALIGLGWASPLGESPQPGLMGMVLQVVAVVLTASVPVVGPIATWLLHGRRIGVAAVLGAVLGAVAGAVTVQGLLLLAMLSGTAAARITGTELAGPIAILIILGAAFVALVVALDIDAVRDLSPSRREHRRLDIARIVATLVVAVFLAAVIGLNLANPRSEIGEAGIIALVAGVFGAVLVAVANAVTTFAERRAARHS